ncbi:hypothetical protein [Actinomyces procaprae]|uniref:hypothetical protein n=1 Tax=Actinomyces procaprae TaxID=2560010 RepID=UPI00109DF1D2|nr:hypothetical protein [Actinomyces procaprae]
MITIIHPVGQGDLGNDIVELGREERLAVQEAKLKRLRQQVDEADVGVLFDGLLNASPGGRGRPGRFKRTPLALVLEALRGADAVVRVILLGTANGREGTETDAVATLLEQACNRPEVKAELEEHFGFPLVVEAYANGDLREQMCIDRLRQWLDADAGIADSEVIVSGIAGATAVVFAAMGLADQMGLNWRLVVAPEEGRDRAVFLDRSPNRAAPFYWLRSLGYTRQATEWAASEGMALPISEEALEETARLTATLDRVRDGQDRGAGALAVLAATDMARADHGAGLALRAWVERRYWELCKEEKRRIEQRGGQAWPPLPFVDSRGKPKMLGPVIGEAEYQLACLGDACPGSTAWLASAGSLNTIGASTVHDGQAPRSGDWGRIESEPALMNRLPKWVTRPGRRPVLYVFNCGVSLMSPTVPERVLGGCAPAELRRAVPGALLDGAGRLPVEFAILHSTHPDSKRAAELNAQTVIIDGDGEHWLPRKNVYELVGCGDRDGDGKPVDPMRSARECLREVLARRLPSAVVIVGTGQKPAVYGALEAAQQWCAVNAVPLFVQTFVDKGRGIKEPAPQFHRIALRNDAEEALRRAAAISLRSLNLLSALRVLAAGDRDMDELAGRCEELRQEYVQARKAERLDDHAGVIVDVLRTVRLLLDGADWLTQARLVVAAAEAVHARRLAKRG